jgi:hypothetical protein
VLQIALGLTAALLIGDSVVTPDPCNWFGTCTQTLTAPDFCTTGGMCLSDAGGSAGLSNPYPGTLVADAGWFNALCLVDGGCISSWPGQVITGNDGGSIAPLNLSMHCEMGSINHNGTATSVNLVHPFLTQYSFCGCDFPTNLGNLCVASASDGGVVNITTNGLANDLWWCCGI